MFLFMYMYVELHIFTVFETETVLQFLKLK